MLGDGRIYQFGIRSGDRPEFRWAAEGHVQMSKFGFDGLKETVLHLHDKPVYFTLDIDVLDPSVFPGTGTPEPGGVTFIQLLEAIYEVCRLHIVACDLTELSPVYDPSGASTAVALKLLREMLLAM
jgi:agmatinase